MFLHEPTRSEAALKDMAELEIQIAKPCNQSWTAMKGDERARFCGVCKKNVFNISEMTRDEVEELIRKTDGHFCARLYRRTDNRVMTKDCPKGVAAYRRKRVLALATAGAAIFYGAKLIPSTPRQLTQEPSTQNPTAPKEPPDFRMGAVLPPEPPPLQPMMGEAIARK